MANSVWTAPAWSDWGWGLLFSLFGPPRGQARKMTRSASVGAKVQRQRRHPLICFQEQRPCALVPRTPASAPLRGLLLAAWWVVPRPAAGFRGAPCKAFVALGVHWAHQGSQSRLFGTPVRAGAPISRPGGGGGGSGSDVLWQPVAPCGTLWRRSRSPIRR